MRLILLIAIVVAGCSPAAPEPPPRPAIVPVPVPVTVEKPEAEQTRELILDDSGNIISAPRARLAELRADYIQVMIDLGTRYRAKQLSQVDYERAKVLSLQCSLAMDHIEIAVFADPFADISKDEARAQTAIDELTAIRVESDLRNTEAQP